MGITGRTSNKLFRVKTRNVNQPYQVGVNGVTDVLEISEQFLRVSYTLDDIDYISFTKNIPLKESYNLDNTTTTTKGELINFKKLVNNSTEDSSLKRTKKTSYLLRFEPDLSKENPKKLVKRFKINTNDLKILSPDSVSYKTNELELNDGNLGTDTIYYTKKRSFDNFTEEKILKKERYVGLINEPIINSDVFMERDYNSVFEKHQRLSEINNLSELTTYRNGYFNVINSI